MFEICRKIKFSIPTERKYKPKVVTQKCDWCEFPKQTTKHYLYDCKVAKQIWQDLSQYINDMYPNVENVSLEEASYKDIWCGTVYAGAHHVFNFMVLVTKQYLYACKCKFESEKMLPNFHSVRNLINMYERLELHNARKSGNVEKHKIKWAGIDTKQKTSCDIDRFVNEYIEKFTC